MRLGIGPNAMTDQRTLGSCKLDAVPASPTTGVRRRMARDHKSAASPDQARRATSDNTELSFRPDCGSLDARRLFHPSRFSWPGASNFQCC
jgi:hypothetical protein